MKDKITILALDDDEEHCELLKRKLSKYERHDVHFSTTLEDFFLKIEKLNPAVFIIDLNLGSDRYSGLQISKFVRKTLGSEVLVFMLSRSNLAHVVKESFDSGVNDYFYKPLDISVLVDKISHHFNDYGEEYRFPFYSIPSPKGQCLISEEIRVAKVSLDFIEFEAGYLIVDNSRFSIDNFLGLGFKASLVETKQLDIAEETNRYTAKFETLTEDQLEKLEKFISG